MHWILIDVPDLEDNPNPQDHLNPPPPLLPQQILQAVPQLPLASQELMEGQQHLEKID